LGGSSGGSSAWAAPFGSEGGRGLLGEARHVALLGSSQEPAQALALLREGLALSVELDDRPGIAESLKTLARVVEPRTGAELIGAAEAARAAAGATRQPDEERRG
jgi:hypothetical protein